MARKRTLFDLYVTGKEVSFDDGADDPVVVWVQKINTKEHEKAVREGNKAKAIKNMVKHSDPETGDWIAYQQQIENDLQRQAYMEILVNQKIEQARAMTEDEVASSGKWAEENYLQGLVEAWTTGMREEYLEDPEAASDEAKKVFEEMEEFEGQVTKKLEGVERQIRKDYDNMTDEDLQKALIERLIGIDADIAWMDAYTKWRILYAVRQPDNHGEYYFDSIDEIEALQPQMHAALREAYNEVSMDLVEGKESSENQDS